MVEGRVGRDVGRSPVALEARECAVERGRSRHHLPSIGARRRTRTGSNVTTADLPQPARRSAGAWVRVKAVPLPGVDVTETVPSCASVKSFTIASPMPVPGLRLSDPPTR